MPHTCGCKKKRKKRAGLVVPTRRKPRKTTAVRRKRTLASRLRNIMAKKINGKTVRWHLKK